MSELCFVYGTLKRGYPNHSVMERAGGIYYGPALLPHYRMFSLGGFPGILPTKEVGEPVHGEVFGVVNWKPLDRLEGYRPGDPENSMYFRQSVLVYLPDQEPVWVQTYIWNGASEFLEDTIQSGVWV